MKHRKFSAVPFFIITSSLLCDLAASQSITRFLDSTKYDEFLNPDNSTCGNNGCAKFLGYKACHDCCTCTCNYGSYLTSKKRCVANEDIVKDCKFSTGEDPYADLLAIMTPKLMKTGQKISYCQNAWDKCSTVVTNCIIDSSNTIYDNGKWRRLWPSNSLVDFEITKKPGESDSLVWISNGCNEHKYDGLLISLQIKCKAHGVAKSVESCLMFKFPGTFKVGENPLIRTNCTTPTKVVQPTKSTKQMLLPTTPSTKAVSLTPRETQPTVVNANSASQKVPSTDHPEKETSKRPKYYLFLSISLPLITLTLVSLMVAGIFAFRRRKSPADCISQRDEDNSTVTANSSVSQTPTVFATDTNGDLSDRTYNMNGDGQHFAMSERPTLFTVSVTEGFYDEPISEPINSLGEISSVVDTTRETDTNMDARYATVMNTVRSPEMNGKIKSNAKISTESDDPTDSDKIWLQNSFSHYSEPYAADESIDAIYDEPDAIVRGCYKTSTSNGKIGEPIYMLYEPLHP